jgi:hypothetical protein
MALTNHQKFQYIRDGVTEGRVKVALYEWAIARLLDNTRIAAQDALAKYLLRGSDSDATARTLFRSLLAWASFNEAALTNDAAGDTSLEAQVAVAIPPLLAKGVLVLADPDAA